MCKSGKCLGASGNQYCSEGKTGSKCGKTTDCDIGDYCLNNVCVNRPTPDNKKDCSNVDAEGNNTCSYKGDKRLKDKQAKCIKLS